MFFTQKMFSKSFDTSRPEHISGDSSYDYSSSSSKSYTPGVNRSVSAFGDNNVLVKARLPYRKRKRRTRRTRRRYVRRRRTYPGTPRVVMTPYGTISGYGGYYDESVKGDFSPNYGARLGSIIGEGIHSFANMLGFGDYAVRSNSLITIPMGNGPPVMRNSKVGEATIVTHREFLGDLRSGMITGGGSVSDFKLQSFRLNPGAPETFPWLSQVATEFQEYEMRGLVFYIKTLSSDFAEQMALGSVFAGTQYNALEPDPSSKQQIENLQYSTSAKPSKDMMHPIECAPINDVNTHLYVSTSVTENLGDRRFYDMGTTYIGTQGIPISDAIIGEIWVTYEVALFKPRLNLQSLAPTAKTAIIQNFSLSDDLGTNDGSVGGALATQVLGTANYPGFIVNKNSVNLPNVNARWYCSYTMITQTNFTAVATPTVTFNANGNLGSGRLAWWSSNAITKNNQLFWVDDVATGQNTISINCVVNVQANDAAILAPCELIFNVAGFTETTPHPRFVTLVITDLDATDNVAP